MKKWLKSQIQDEVENIEEVFFRTLLIISLVSSFIILFFDVMLKEEPNLIGLHILFIGIVILTLYFLKKVMFHYVTVVSIGLLDVLFTYRGLFADGYLQITAILLITLGFISSLITRGSGRVFLKAMVAFSLVIVLFREYKQVDPAMLIRQAIPYGVIYLIVAIFSGILKSRYERNQDRLTKLIDLLNQKNLKIEEQHSDLVKSYDQLSKLNVNLGQLVKHKTYHIEQKNKQLTEIAYTNAHQIRGPLARILGLLQLIAVDPGNTGQYLIRIDNEANDMDKITKEVGESIELTILD